MDTLELNRASPQAVPRPEFPAFLARAPWLNCDLQTLRNFLVGRRPELDDYAAQRLFLPMRDGSGDRLVGTLGLPPAIFGAQPLVVLIHGLSGCEDSFYLRKSAAHLLSLGFPVLRLNLRGAGPSRTHCRFQYHAGASEDFAHTLDALPAPLTRAGWGARAAFDRFPRTTFALARLPITFKAVEKLLRGDLTHPGAARGLEKGAVKLIYTVAKAAAR